MHYLPRVPEKQEVEASALNVFSRVSRWGGFAAAKRVQKILGSYLSSGKTVLDVGTGPAAIPLYLKRFFPSACFSGLDISISMLEKAKENRNILNEDIILLSGDAMVMPFRTKSIDVVTAFFVMHHVSNPGSFFNEIDRVLKPNGVFLSIDFRRDMSRKLFHTLNVLWQSAFFFSSGRFGIRESIRASWTSVEIENILVQNSLSGFKIHINPMELWIYKGLK